MCTLTGYNVVQAVGTFREVSHRRTQKAALDTRNPLWLSPCPWAQSWYIDRLGEGAASSQGTQARFQAVLWVDYVPFSSDPQASLERDGILVGRESVYCSNTHPDTPRA